MLQFFIDLFFISIILVAINAVLQLLDINIWEKLFGINLNKIKNAINIKYSEEDKEDVFCSECKFCIESTDESGQYVYKCNNENNLVEFFNAYKKELIYPNINDVNEYNDCEYFEQKDL